jgi:putative transposase
VHGRQIRYRVMYHYREKYPIRAMSEFFNLSRAAYYAWVKRMDRPDRDDERMKLVMEAYLGSRKIYGYRRIQAWLLRRRGKIINHKAVLRLMNKLGIRSVARRRKMYKSAAQQFGTYTYPNLLDRDFHASQPNQKWVTDITQIYTHQGWFYLSVIKDLYDGFIIAHHTSRNNSVELVTRTLQIAKEKEVATDGLALHSDHGDQYCSHPYYLLTQQYNFTPSMSRRGNCLDNAPIENFFSHLKEEAIRQVKLKTFQQAQEVIDDYIDFYNYERIQLKTKLTPFERRCQSP